MKVRFSHLAALAIVLTVGLMAPAVLKAHAKLVKTLPAADATLTTAPAEIQISFDEAVDVKVSRIALAGPSGKIAVGPTKLMGPKSIVAAVTGALADAAYTVTWQTAAADDGHLSKGTFKFTLKKSH